MKVIKLSFRGIQWRKTGMQKLMVLSALLAFFSSCGMINIGALNNESLRRQHASNRTKAAVNLNKSNHINVKDYGAKGDGVTDDSQAFIKAIEASVKSAKMCYVPKSDRHYLIDETVRVPLKSGQSITLVSDGAVIRTGKDIRESSARIWKLTPTYKEFAIFSFGPTADNKAFPHNFTNNKKIKVSISGLTFDAISHARGPVPVNGSLIVSALDISAEEIIVKDCDFLNIMGYGIRTFGVKNYQNTNNVFDNVGGRGVGTSTDAYGDGIFTCAVANGGKIAVTDNLIMGSNRSRRKSRSGITFEFSQHKYTANITNCSIIGYAKSIHIEEPAPSSITVRNCKLLDANYTIAMVLNKQAVCNVHDSEIVINGTDRVDGGDGGPVINTNGGGTINFYNTKLLLNGPQHAYISMVGVKEVTDCTINGYNKNPYFADANTIFTGCTFYDFGGKEKSFFSYVGNNSFRVVNSTFHRGGDVHANGQRVKLSFENTRAVSSGVKLTKR